MYQSDKFEYPWTLKVLSLEADGLSQWAPNNSRKEIDNLVAKFPKH